MVFLPIKRADMVTSNREEVGESEIFIGGYSMRSTALGNCRMFLSYLWFLIQAFLDVGFVSGYIYDIYNKPLLLGESQPW